MQVWMELQVEEKLKLTFFLFSPLESFKNQFWKTENTLHTFTTQSLILQKSTA